MIVKIKYITVVVLYKNNMVFGHDCFVKQFFNGKN